MVTLVHSLLFRDDRRPLFPTRLRYGQGWGWGESRSRRGRGQSSSTVCLGVLSLAVRTGCLPAFGFDFSGRLPD